MGIITAWVLVTLNYRAAFNFGRGSDIVESSPNHYQSSLNNRTHRSPNIHSFRFAFIHVILKIWKKIYQILFMKKFPITNIFMVYYALKERWDTFSTSVCVQCVNASWEKSNENIHDSEKSPRLLRFFFFFFFYKMCVISDLFLLS